MWNGHSAAGIDFLARSQIRSLTAVINCRYFVLFTLDIIYTTAHAPLLRPLIVSSLHRELWSNNNDDNINLL